MGFLLQGIFPTQGSNPCLLCFLHCRQILYPLSHWRSLFRNTQVLIPGPGNVNLLWLKDLEKIALKLLRWEDYPGLSVWASECSLSVPIRRRRFDCRKEWPWNHILHCWLWRWKKAALTTGKGKERDSRECATDFGLLTSGTVREYVCVVLSYQVCSHLWQQP